MPLNLFYTMVQKSQKWPKTQIKGVLHKWTDLSSRAINAFQHSRNFVDHAYFQAVAHISLLEKGCFNSRHSLHLFVCAADKPPPTLREERPWAPEGGPLDSLDCGSFPSIPQALTARPQESFCSSERSPSGRDEAGRSDPWVCTRLVIRDGGPRSLLVGIATSSRGRVVWFVLAMNRTKGRWKKLHQQPLFFVAVGAFFSQRPLTEQSTTLYLCVTVLLTRRCFWCTWECFLALEFVSLHVLVAGELFLFL